MGLVCVGCDIEMGECISRCWFACICYRVIFQERLYLDIMHAWFHILRYLLSLI